MANLPLTGNSISTSYQGLLKSSDNTALGATEKIMVDGLGNASTLSLGTSSASFTGTLDLSGATVTGLPAGSAGLESGSGADSMQSAASLTTTAASATGAQTIAIGEGAVAPNANDINIGDSNTIAAKSILPGDIVIGRDNASSTVNGGSNILIGESNAVTQNEQNIAIGRSNTISRGTITVFGSGNTASSQYGSVIFGNNNNSTTEDSIIAGNSNTHTQKWTTTVGRNNTGGNRESVTIGSGINQGSYRGIGIGYDADTGSGFGNVNIGIESGTDLGTGSFKIALGYRASSEADSAIAIGPNVVAAKANTLTTEALELLTNSTPTAGGIVLHDAGGTERRLNLDASGALQIDSTPVGGGGGATPAMGFQTLPQFANNNFSANDTDVGERTWVSTTGYALTNMGTNPMSNTNVGFAVFSMQPGEILEQIKFNVSTAGAAASTIELAVYEIVFRTVSGIGTYGSGLVLGDKVKDLGTVAADSTGVKTINIAASPYTQPTNADYGAIAIAWGTSDSATRISSWSQSVWDTMTVTNSGTTSYRMVQPYVADARAAGAALPTNLSAGTLVYKGETSNPAWMFIQTKM